MKVITQNDMIREWIDRKNAGYFDHIFREKGIEFIPVCPDADLINEIMDNVDWTTAICDECCSRVTCVVELGEEKDYDSCTADICPDCIKEAHDALS